MFLPIALTAQTQDKTPELKMNEWVSFKDKDGEFQIKLVPSKENPEKLDRIDVKLIAPTGEFLVGKVVAFNKGGLGYYYLMGGFTGQEDYVFRVSVGGGQACKESFDYVEAALNTYYGTHEFYKDFSITFK